MRLTPMLVLVLSVAGCSVSVTHEAAYDSEQARTTLTTALEAWKNGKTQSLGKLTPPIRFVDDDLRAGYKLVAFEFSDPNAAIQPFQGAELRLTLKRGAGEQVKRTAVYQVTLSPKLAVLRSDP